MRIVLTFVAFLTVFGSYGCNSDESLLFEEAGADSGLNPETGSDAKVDSKVDALVETGKDAVVEAQADVVIDSALPEASEPEAAEPDAEPDVEDPDAAEPNLYPECLAFADDGVLRVYLFVPVDSARYVSLFGWIDFPTTADTEFGGICWTDQPGTNELRCELMDADKLPAQAYPGTKAELTPGVSLTNGGEQVSWYCDSTSCPNIKIMVLCNGQTGIGRIDDGVEYGSVKPNPNGNGGVNPFFTVPDPSIPDPDAG